MIDEEAELGLISRPMRWAVKGEGQEQDIGGRKKCCLGEERAGQKADRKQSLEYGRDPGEQERCRNSRCGDIARGGGHAEKLEGGGHDENAGEYDPADKDGGRLPQRR